MFTVCSCVAFYYPLPKRTEILLKLLPFRCAQELKFLTLTVILRVTFRCPRYFYARTETASSLSPKRRLRRLRRLCSPDHRALQVLIFAVKNKNKMNPA